MDKSIIIFTNVILILGISGLTAVLVAGLMKSCRVEAKYSSLAMWQNYFDEIVERENFEEAERILQFLNGKDKNDPILLPKGYEVYSSTDREGNTQPKIVKL